MGCPSRSAILELKDEEQRQRILRRCGSGRRIALSVPYAHRGLPLLTPIGNPRPAVDDLRSANVRRRDVLGGLIHEYRVAA